MGSLFASLPKHLWPVLPVGSLYDDSDVLKVHEARSYRQLSCFSEQVVTVKVFNGAVSAGSGCKKSDSDFLVTFQDITSKRTSSLLNSVHMQVFAHTLPESIMKRDQVEYKYDPADLPPAPRTRSLLKQSRLW